MRGTVLMPILQMWKLRFREVGYLNHNCTARKEQESEFKPNGLALDSLLLITWLSAPREKLRGKKLLIIGG